MREKKTDRVTGGAWVDILETSTFNIDITILHLDQFRAVHFTDVLQTLRAVINMGTSSKWDVSLSVI